MQSTTGSSHVVAALILEPATNTAPAPQAVGCAWLRCSRAAGVISLNDAAQMVGASSIADPLVSMTSQEAGRLLGVGLVCCQRRRWRCQRHDPVIKEHLLHVWCDHYAEAAAIHTAAGQADDKRCKRGCCDATSSKHGAALPCSSHLLEPDSGSVIDRHGHSFVVSSMQVRILFSSAPD